MSLPDPPKRSPDSQDWRFAVLVLAILLVASLVTGIVLYVEDGAIPEGIGNFASALVGALIVIIGKRMI